MGTVRVERCPDCQSLVGEGGLYQHQERYCEKRKPKVYSEEFLSHAVVARSQYQPIVRDMATEILSLRHALAEAKGEIAARSWQPIETAPKDVTVVGWCVHKRKADGPEFVTWVNRKWNYWGRERGSKVTHWQPLPSPPDAAASPRKETT